MPALVRLISDFYLSVSVAVSGGESERKKPSSGCADLAGKNAVSVAGRTQISLGVRTLFQQEEEGRRSEGTVIDPALEIVDLSRYLQICFCRLQIWRGSTRSSLGDCRSEEILADPA